MHLFTGKADTKGNRQRLRLCLRLRVRRLMCYDLLWACSSSRLGVITLGIHKALADTVAAQVCPFQMTITLNLAPVPAPPVAANELSPAVNVALSVLNAIILADIPSAVTLRMPTPLAPVIVNISPTR